MDLNAILDECLDRLTTGEPVESCLARYPEHARELAPMLRAAQQVRALSELHLTYGQRTRGKMALRDMLAAREKRPRGALWGWLQPAPMALFLAVVLFIGAAVTTVAFSRPGDAAYPVRIAAEQVGVWAQPSAQARANREVDAAARRLEDLRAYMVRSGEAQPLLLDALLRNEEAAARRAQALTEDQRAALAERIAWHVDDLNALADDAVDPQAAGQLRLAAAQIQGLVARLQPRPDVGPVVNILSTPTRAAPALAVQKTPSAAATPEAERVERSPSAPGLQPAVTVSAGPVRTQPPQTQPWPSVSPAPGGPVLSPLPAETPYRRLTAARPFTPSATARASSTWTPGPTGTPTATWTPTTTWTPWRSVTPSPSWTAAFTPSATVTAPVIPTQTRRPKPVETMTVPVFPTLSATPKWWPTSAPPRTATRTPTWTLTPTLAAPTATSTPTATPDIWATATARAVSSATVTPTAQPTRSPTATQSPTPPPTVRWQPIPTLTPAATQSPTPPPTIRWQPIPTVTVVGPVPTTTVTVVMPPFLTRTAGPPMGTVTITVTPRGPRSTDVGAIPTPTRPRRSR